MQYDLKLGKFWECLIGPKDVTPNISKTKTSFSRTKVTKTQPDIADHRFLFKPREEIQVNPFQEKVRLLITVWPDVAKFRRFGYFLQALAKIVFGKIAKKNGENFGEFFELVTRHFGNTNELILSIKCLVNIDL